MSGNVAESETKRVCVCVRQQAFEDHNVTCGWLRDGKDPFFPKSLFLSSIKVPEIQPKRYVSLHHEYFGDVKRI